MKHFSCSKIHFFRSRKKSQKRQRKNLWKIEQLIWLVMPTIQIPKNQTQIPGIDKSEKSEEAAI